jgi:hypothetical protein
MSLRVTTWSSETALLELMRGYVQAANRLSYAQRRSEFDDAEYRAMQEAHEEAAAAFEDALAQRGWRIPGRRPESRSAVSL